MKRHFIAAGLLVGLMALPPRASAHEPKVHASAAPTQEIAEQAKPAVAVVDQFSIALKAGDLKRAGGFLAADVLILESGEAETSREEYLGGHALFDAAFLKQARIDVKRRTARVEGSFAWVGTESELHASTDGKPMTLLSTETMVLKKTPSGWRIVHIHWSSRPKQGA